MFVVRKIISSKFKHNGQNIWQKLGWVSLHSQTSIRPDYNELRLVRAQLIKMVDTLMKALVSLLRRWVIQSYTKKYLQGDAMDVAYDFINDSRTKMARPSVVRVDWEQGEGAGGGGAKFLPSLWRAAQAPRSMARAQQLFIRRFLGTDSRTKTQDFASIRIQVKMRARQPVLEPHSFCTVKKAKSWLETISLWR